MRKRTKEVKVRLTEAEYAALNEAFAKTGLANREVFLRQVIEGIKVYERPHLDTPLLIRQIRRLGANLDQMAHWAYAHGYVEAKMLRILCVDIRQLELLFQDWVMNPDKAPAELPPRPLHTTKFNEALQESFDQEEFNKDLEKEALRDQYMEELLAKEMDEEKKPVSESAIIPSEEVEKKGSDDPLPVSDARPKTWLWQKSRKQ